MFVVLVAECVCACLLVLCFSYVAVSFRCFFSLFLFVVSFCCLLFVPNSAEEKTNCVICCFWGVSFTCVALCVFLLSVLFGVCVYLFFVYTVCVCGCVRLCICFVKMLYELMNAFWCVVFLLGVCLIGFVCCFVCVLRCLFVLVC